MRQIMESPRTQSQPRQTGEQASSRPHFVADAFAKARKHYCELQEYVCFYLTAQVDRVKFTLKRLVFFAALGVLALLAVAALMVTAAVQVCYGISHLLTIAFGGRLWLADLVTGLIIWIVIMSATFIGIMFILKQSRKATMEKYDKRRQNQRADFGRDVQQRSAEGRK